MKTHNKILSACSLVAALTLSASAAQITTTTGSQGETIVTETVVKDGLTTITVTTTYPDGRVTTETTKSQENVEITRGLLDVPRYVEWPNSPRVGWDLTEEVSLDQLVKRTSTGVTALTDLRVEVTVLGTGVTSGSGSRYTSFRTQGELKIGNQAWALVHDGNEDAVVPNKVTYSTTAKEGDEFQFRSRFLFNSWQGYRYHSGSDVLTLANNEKIPSNKPENEAVKSAEQFLQPYLNEDSTLDLGELDFVYVAELTHTDKNASGYDLQDLIVHVSVRPISE